MRTEKKKGSPAAVRNLKLEIEYWEPEFWLGYRRGLNRLRHGEIFANAEMHRSWHGTPDNIEEGTSIELVARGIGYRAGFAGIAIEEAAVKLREFIDRLAKKYDCR